MADQKTGTKKGPKSSSGDGEVVENLAGLREDARDEAESEVIDLSSEVRKYDRPHLQILHTEFLRRKSRNPRYSLRAYATQLEIHPSAMSRILASKQDLSLASAQIILNRLTMEPDEKRAFILSVAEEKYDRAVALLAKSAGVDVPAGSSADFFQSGLSRTGD